ncbi:MAG: TIGR02147 family protein [Chitinispirillaceae bacterium]|nr:TIGR02147 family protein [Chitinispirillaceae bacterium]
MGNTARPEIYNYLDYRHYLADLFAALQESNRAVSKRTFARMAGSTSPNYLQLIIDRKLNIKPSGISALAKSLKLAAKERRFFELLAAFDHAATHEDKDRFFRHIVRAKEYLAVHSLDRHQYEMFSHWYIPVIRELITAKGFTGDPAWIGSRIIPAVSPAKVKKAISVLESLGLIREEQGRWAQTNRVVCTPAEVLSLAVTTYHKHVIELSHDAIERFKPAERDIRSVTFGISKAGYEEIKKRQETFWKELLAYADTQTSVDRVYQMNMQLFPVSKGREEQT